MEVMEVGTYYTTSAHPGAVWLALSFGRAFMVYRPEWAPYPDPCAAVGAYGHDAQPVTPVFKDRRIVGMAPRPLKVAQLRLGL